MRRRILLPLLIAFLACKSEPDAPAFPFDPNAAFEIFEHDTTVDDAPYTLDRSTLFRTQDQLGSLAVSSLAFLEGRLYAGTAGGLYRSNAAGTGFERVALHDDLPVIDLAVRGNELAVLQADRVSWGAVATLADAPVITSTSGVNGTAVGFAVADVVWVGTSQGLLRVPRTGATRVAATAGIGIRDLFAENGVVHMATSAGVARFETAGQRLLSSFRAPNELLDDDVRALTLSSDRNTVLAATALGLARIPIAGGAAVLDAAAVDGLPTDQLTAVSELDGTVLLGHAIGATRFDTASRKSDHYHSLRWIPGEAVTSVALDPADKARWIGTGAGIARIGDGSDTLAARAELNEGFLQERHWRMDGFVDDDVSIDDPWVLGPFHTDDKDNDGLWTEMQIGAWCYAYSVTGDERFYRSAKKAMDVMFLQFDIPAVTFMAAGRKAGFITRSLVRDDEGAVFSSKAPQSNWHLQEFGGRSYYWKDDTSSDEYAGHYFGIPIYYDLCAKDEGEKEEIRKRIRLSTDYLVDNGEKLIDLDGERTLHGHWNDLAIAVNGLDYCTEKYGIDRVSDCVFSRHGGGWLNGAQILGHLLATWHITGDQKYYDEYERLFTTEKYGQLIKITPDVFTVTEPAFANHSDHELAMLAYTTLLRYEPNPDRRAQYVQSLLDFYEYERKEHNPWQVAVIAAYHPGEVDTGGAIQTLREMPVDWRTFRYDNSHRKDAKSWPNDRHMSPQFNRVFAYDEIRTMKWNGNPYAKDGGGSGRSLLSPTPYLLSYWMLRYHHVLGE